MAGSGATLLQFSTEFCFPCRTAHSLLGALAAGLPGIRHVDVDVSARPDLAGRFTLLQSPTTFILDSAGAVRARIGVAPRSADVRAELNRILETAWSTLPPDRPCQPIDPATPSTLPTLPAESPPMTNTTPSSPPLAASKRELVANPGGRGIDPRASRFSAGITAVPLLVVIGLALSGGIAPATTLAERAGQPAFILFAVITSLFALVHSPAYPATPTAGSIAR